MPEITDYLSKYLGSFNIKYIIYRDIWNFQKCLFPQKNNLFIFVKGK
jgi:hypothetical protein